MHQAEMEVFVRIPSEAKKRELEPGVVEAVDGSSLRVRLQQPRAELEAEAEVLLHFELRRKFVQQAVRIEAIDEPEAEVLTLSVSGDPVSAESRQSYRSSTMGADVRAQVGKEDCTVVDVSATGFAVYSAKELKVGKKTKVAIQYEGKEYAGEAVVQSSRRINKEQTRYGLHVVTARGAQSTLATGLPQLNGAIQSAQLRRLRGLD